MRFRLFENARAEVMGKPNSQADIKPVIRRIFTSDDGKKLLRYMLFDLGFFSICTTPEEQATRNWAAKFLNELGNVFDVEISADIKIREEGK